MNVQVSAAAAEEVASRVPPLGQQPLGKHFRQLTSQSSASHLTPADRAGPAGVAAPSSEDGKRSKEGRYSEGKSDAGDGKSNNYQSPAGVVGSVAPGRAVRMAAEHSRRCSPVAHLTGAVPRQLNALLWSPKPLRRRPPQAAPERVDHVYYRVCCQLKRHLRQLRRPPVVVVADSTECELSRQAVCIFGRSPSLREAANLVIVLPRPEQGDEEEQLAGCAKQLLLAIDRYDLYGHVALLRPRSPHDEITELLRIAHDHRGVLLVDELGDADEGSDANGSLIRLSSALRVPIVSADAEYASDVQDDSTQKSKLSPVARIHALLA